MGASKQLHMDIRIQAETELELWESLPQEYKERFSIKRIEVDTINGQPSKEVYKTCETWKSIQEELKDVMKRRTEAEEQIRVNLRNEQ
jgi:hypothetical protein